MTFDILDVRRATPARHRHVEVAIVEPMLADPAWRHLFPDPEVRRTALSHLVRSGMAEAAQADALILAALLDGEVVGGLVCVPPDQIHLRGGAYLRGVARAAGFLVRRPVSALRALRLVLGIQSQLPADPVVYLEWVGVRPDVQGRGVGTALCLAALDLAAVPGVDFYLETTNPENVVLYAGFGFAPLGGPVVAYRGGPEMWRMRRPAGGGAGMSGPRALLG